MCKKTQTWLSSLFMGVWYNMKCPNCDAIMLIDWFEWIDKFVYKYQETCSVCRVIRQCIENIQISKEYKKWVE